MSRSVVFIIGFLGLILIFGISLFSSYVSSYNYGNRMENQIQSQYQQMQNVLTQYYQRVNEISQVPSMYKGDLKEIVNASIQGRYGKDGSKAVFQFLKEHNVSLDSQMYLKIQQVIESGRNNFEFENKKLIDIKNEYNVALGSFFQGFWLRLSGYPKIDLNKFRVITNDYSNQVFETGKEDSFIKLR